MKRRNLKKFYNLTEYQIHFNNQVKMFPILRIEERI